MRDYEKYIARQLKRGTSRQELNISWLKKNEMDIKRHVQDLRDNIRTNWATTGTELSKELRVFWPSSRPQSPAPGGRRNAPPTTPGGSNGDVSLREAATMANAAKSPTTPGGERQAPNDFVTGYTLGLIGGVRSWVQSPFYSSTPHQHLLTRASQMTKNRRNVGESSRPVSRSPSDDDSEESDSKTSGRGRQPAAASSSGAAKV